MILRVAAVRKEHFEEILLWPSTSEAPVGRPCASINCTFVLKKREPCHRGYPAGTMLWNKTSPSSKQVLLQVQRQHCYTADEAPGFQRVRMKFQVSSRDKTLSFKTVWMEDVCRTHAPAASQESKRRFWLRFGDACNASFRDPSIFLTNPKPRDSMALADRGIP